MRFFRHLQGQALGRPVLFYIRRRAACSLIRRWRVFPFRIADARETFLGRSRVGCVYTLREGYSVGLVSGEGPSEVRLSFAMSVSCERKLL